MEDYMRGDRKPTSVWLTEAQKAKLRQLASTLGNSPNAIVGQLVDNAAIGIVTRHEAVATLPAQKNNRHDAQNLTGSSITAVGD